MSRAHNDSNVLCVAGDQSGETTLKKMVEAWLTSEFSGGRHERRVNKISMIEKGQDPRQYSD
jgi:ribose 5-phosphate isomerase B